MNDEQLSKLLREHASRYRASDQLRAQIHTHAVLEEAARADAPLRPGLGAVLRERLERLSHHVQAGWRYLALGAGGGAVATACVALLVVHVQLGAPEGSQWVSAHVRSLKAGPLVQVVSTNRHTVKPWFQGKVDFAPPVIHLEEAGYLLVGGRVEEVGGHTVAALIYSRDQHLLNLFVAPDRQVRALERQLVSGFSVVGWSDGSMRYTLVGDIGLPEAEQFGRRWQLALKAEGSAKPQPAVSSQ